MILESLETQTTLSDCWLGAEGPKSDSCPKDGTQVIVR